MRCVAEDNTTSKPAGIPTAKHQPKRTNGKKKWTNGTELTYARLAIPESWFLLWWLPVDRSTRPMRTPRSLSPVMSEARRNSERRTERCTTTPPVGEPGCLLTHHGAADVRLGRTPDLMVLTRVWGLSLGFGRSTRSIDRGSADSTPTHAPLSPTPQRPADLLVISHPPSKTTWEASCVAPTARLTGTRPITPSTTDRTPAWRLGKRGQRGPVGDRERDARKRGGVLLLASRSSSPCGLVVFVSAGKERAGRGHPAAAAAACVHTYIERGPADQRESAAP